MKKIIISCFIVFGLIVGFISVWFSRNTDAIFLANIPGSGLGDLVYALSIRFLGDPNSAQAHYTIPWLLRVPQVYVATSIIFWGIAGTLFTILFKPKVIAWIMGIYLAVFGIVYLIFSQTLF